MRRTFLQMIERATEWLRDPNLGLHVGQAMRPGYMGAHGFSLMACATVRDLLPRLQRYTILLYEGCRDEFEERDGQLQRLQTSAEPAWLQSCKGAIMNALRTGTPELEQIAPQLELSPRSLRRKLAEQGLSFRSLLDELRCELAKRYIEDPGLTLVEMAYLLGYSDQSTFQRAFRRWIGQAPARYRRTLICVDAA